MIGLVFIGKIFRALLTDLDETGLAILVGIALFITLIAFGQALVPHDPMAARLRSHLKRRDRLRAELLAGKRSGLPARHPSVGTLRRVLDYLKLLRGQDARDTSDQLARAGWRSHDALVIYLGLRIAMPIGAGLLGLLLLLTTLPELTLLQNLLGVLLAIVVFGYAPVILLRLAIGRREARLRKQVPDALDLLVICAESGLSLDAAMTRVARELGPSAPELADELGLTAVELGFLPDRRQALQNLARRAAVPSIRGVVHALVQTERYGTPLAHSLRVLAAEFREERMLKAEEKAAKLPATLTVPLVVFIMPALVIVLVGPAIIRAFETFK